MDEAFRYLREQLGGQGRVRVEAWERVGQFCFQHFYGGDLQRFRSKRKDKGGATLRALVELCERRGLGVSVSRLHAAISQSLQTRALRGRCPAYEKLSTTQRRYLLPLSETADKAELAERAVAAGWSCRTLQEAVWQRLALRDPDRVRRRPDPLQRLVTELQRLLAPGTLAFSDLTGIRAADGGEPLADALDGFAAQLTAVADHVRRDAPGPDPGAVRALFEQGDGAEGTPAQPAARPAAVKPSAARPAAAEPPAQPTARPAAAEPPAQPTARPAAAETPAQPTAKPSAAKPAAAETPAQSAAQAPVSTRVDTEAEAPAAKPAAAKSPAAETPAQSAAQAPVYTRVSTPETHDGGEREASPSTPRRADDDDLSER
jgi:hypothetical protein